MSSQKVIIIGLALCLSLNIILSVRGPKISEAKPVVAEAAPQTAQAGPAQAGQTQAGQTQAGQTQGAQNTGAGKATGLVGAALEEMQNVRIRNINNNFGDDGATVTSRNNNFLTGGGAIVNRNNNFIGGQLFNNTSGNAANAGNVAEAAPIKVDGSS